MTRYRKLAGLSLMEALVTLSIIATLGALAAPSIEKAKRDTYVLKCKAQLQEIGVALIKYRDDHSGRMPIDIGELVPQYLQESRLVCPLTTNVVPETVKAWQEYAKRVAESPKAVPFPGIGKWSSYRYVSPFFVDMHNRDDPTKSPLSHSELLARRGSDTPMLICRDHREPFSLDPFLGIPSDRRPVIPGFPTISFPLWNYPEDDIALLRWDGRVSVTKKGGSKLQGTFISTTADELEL